ncbi:prevent-host-death family protein [Streptomyces ambofaciens]
MAYEIPVTQARAELADLINRVVYGGERVVVTRHGKPLVALVSASDLERLEEAEGSPDGQVISSVAAVHDPRRRDTPRAPPLRHRRGAPGAEPFVAPGGRARPGAGVRPDAGTPEATSGIGNQSVKTG